MIINPIDLMKKKKKQEQEGVPTQQYEQPIGPSKPKPEEPKEVLETSFDRAQDRLTEEQIALRRQHFHISAAKGLTQHESDQLWRDMLAGVGAREDMITQQITGAEIERQRQQEELASRLGVVGGDVQQTEGGPEIDHRQAILFGTKAGVTTGVGALGLKTMFGGVAVAAAGGAKKGGILGSVLGPKGAVAGALAGAIIVGGAAFAAGVMTNIAMQQSGFERAYKTNLADNKQMARESVAMMHMDPDNAEIYLQAYNEIKSKMHQDYAEFVAMTSKDLSLSLGRDGTALRSRYEHALGPLGFMDIMEQKARIALEAPDINKGVMMMTSVNIGEE